MAKYVKTFDAATGSSRTASGGGLLTVSGGGVTLVDTNTTQTLTGKTITTPTVTYNVATLAGLGSSIADAAPIVTAAPCLILATGGNNAVGVLLPVAAAGMRIVIKNDDVANGIMKVYPQVNSKINSTANSAISLAANTCCEFLAFNATYWVTNKVPC
jgi:hypothetical protein